MARRIRSTDGSKDTDKVLGAEGDVETAGRAGGRLPREIGTRDEEKRATERPAGSTRVTKSDEAGDQDVE